MTRTEELQSAWKVLQCNNLIREMFAEASSKPDEIEFSVNRLKLLGDEFISSEKVKKIGAMVQQMMLCDITANELTDYMEKMKSNKLKPRATAMHVATYKGVRVYKGKPLPTVIKEAGWNRLNKIPDEYLTQEYRDYKNNSQRKNSADNSCNDTILFAS